MHTYEDHEFIALGRLAPGITAALLYNQLAAVQRQIKAAHPGPAVRDSVMGHRTQPVAPKRPEELFDSFDVKALATASIGQIHVAYLNRRKVAVKVPRPTVDIDFKGDIRLMSAMIRLIRLVRLKWLYWTIEPMSEFMAWTREELDY
jgi:predicted unusual protein kinase regulating ubiquinone biosynthesis (AarF/ABC1/UbiB family)